MSWLDDIDREVLGDIYGFLSVKLVPNYLSDRYPWTCFCYVSEKFIIEGNGSTKEEAKLKAKEVLDSLQKRCSDLSETVDRLVV